MGYQDGRRHGGSDFGSDFDRNRERGYGPREHYQRDGRRDAPRGYDPDDRGFFDRAGDEVRSWFGDEEAERRREYDERMNRRYGDPREQSNRLGFAGGGSGGGYQPYRGQQSDGTAPSPYGQTAYGPEVEYGAHHDPHYAAWRNDRLRELDRDYHEYQRENRQRFDAEFGMWRKRRTTQRGLIDQVQEHMDVVGSDGAHVGTVDKTAGDRIILTKTDKDAGGVHHSIPHNWVDKVEGQTVMLEKTADQAHAAWKAERDQQALFGQTNGDRTQYGARQGQHDDGGRNR